MELEQPWHTQQESTPTGLLSQVYLDPPALEGSRGEDVVVVVLGQLLQELPHLLLPFEGAHLGSDRWLLLICRIQTGIA